MDALLNLLTGGNSVLLALGGGLIAVVIAWLRGRMTGARAERDRRAARDLKTAEDRLEMHREATEEERRAAAMTDEEAKEEARRWSKP